MGYGQAFEALKDSDFKRAVPLFEQAARETGYTSDVINHAFTLCEIMNRFPKHFHLFEEQEMSGRFDPACILSECCRRSDSWAILSDVSRFWM